MTKPTKPFLKGEKRLVKIEIYPPAYDLSFSLFLFCNCWRINLGNQKEVLERDVTMRISFSFLFFGQDGERKEEIQESWVFT